MLAEPLAGLFARKATGKPWAFIKPLDMKNTSCFPAGIVIAQMMKHIKKSGIPDSFLFFAEQNSQCTGAAMAGDGASGYSDQYLVKSQNAVHCLHAGS